VTDGMKVDLNEAMIQERAQQMVQDMAQRIQNQGIPFEQYLSWMGTNKEDFTKMQLQNAEKTIRQELALAKIAELEGLTVTEEDKEAELQKVAEQYGVDVDAVKNFMDTEMFTDGILYNKAADFLIANATALPEPPAEEEKPEEKPAEEKAEEPEKAE
jgi:trigger factor